MNDFIQIGGEIISSPLNENFRRLRNAVNLANAGMIFSETDGVVESIADRDAIEDPEYGQMCYVESNGKFYRYDLPQQKWIEVADFGNTFKYAYLNSGAILLADCMRMKLGSTDTLIMPEMLVYFHDQPGDGFYLRGMYKVNSQELQLTNVTSGTAYSIILKDDLTYTYVSGLPTTNKQSEFYIGSVLIDGNGEIMNNFIFTLPDMAVTADRGIFMVDGGQVEGGVLGVENNTLTRAKGWYYDEGAGYPIGAIADYPTSVGDKSDFNLAYIDAMNPADVLFYSSQQNTLTTGFTEYNSLQYKKYFIGSTSYDVPANYYTIQHHLLLPTGQDVILYGNAAYPSYEDASSHLNSEYIADLGFPYAEVTRIIIKNTGNTAPSLDPAQRECVFITTQRLSQVGTITPSFNEAEFEVYKNAQSTNPLKTKYNLDLINQNTYLRPSKTFEATYYYFALDQEYDGLDSNGNDVITSRTKSGSGELSFTAASGAHCYGYEITPLPFLDRLKTRVDAIETEIWKVYDNTKTNMYEQGVKYRLAQDEKTMNGHIAKVGSGTVSDTNPHGLTTANVPDSSNKRYVTDAYLSALANVPANTNTELANKLTNLIAYTKDRNTETNTLVGTFKAISIYNDTMTASVVNDILTIGAPADMMCESAYATGSTTTNQLWVDKALVAQRLMSSATAQLNQYYGTNDTSTISGFYNLPIYVDAEVVSGMPSYSVYHIVDNTISVVGYDSNNTLVSDNDVTKLILGNNLLVTINNHEATINATGSGAGVSRFANLEDVNVDMIGSNLGKILAIGNDSSGNIAIIPQTLSTITGAMMIDDYTSASDRTKVLKAIDADNAATLNGTVVDDTSSTTGLWTASQITTYVGNQITAQGVATYVGTTQPSQHTFPTTPKQGDLYIMVEA